MRFWDVLKEMSATNIRNEAGRLFVLSFAGEPELTAAACEVALGAATPEQRAAAEPYYYAASPPYALAEESRLRYSDLLVSFPGGPGITEFRPADTIQLENPAGLVPAVLERRPDLRLALARRLPGFRALAAEQVIRDVSRVNAEFAAITGVVGVIPGLAGLFPPAAGADVFMLTKNQFLMVFRLAAVYGEDLALNKRLREIAAIAGGAFGWRTLARELAGALPGGLGLPIRAGIAFSGTYASGRAAQMVFDQGRRPNRQEMFRIYAEGSELAKDTVARLKERLSKKQSLAPPMLALPEPASRDPQPEAESESGSETGVSA